MLLVAWKLDSSTLKSQRNEIEEDGGKRSVLSKLKRVDFVGSAFLIATIVPLLLVLDTGGSKVPWNSPLILVLVSVGIKSGILFVLAERQAKEPIFPLRLLTNYTVVTSYVLMMLQNASQVAVSYKSHPGERKETPLLMRKHNR